MQYQKPSLFSMTRKNKEDAPLNKFFDYYAFKTEERNFFLRYTNQQPSSIASLKESITGPIPTWKAFMNYICESKMISREYFISQKKYCELEFINEVPEIVCDVLFYLSGYIHYRTDRISLEGYEKMLRC